MTKLWILNPSENLTSGDNPWDPWYDKAFGFVVRAETEAEARRFAHEEAGGENRGVFLDKKIANTNTPWLEAKYSTCVELTAEGEVGVVLQDSQSA